MSGLTGVLAAGAMGFVLSILGAPYNPVWWWVMGAVLAAAFVVPYVMASIVEGLVVPKGPERHRARGAMSRRALLYAGGALALASGAASYVLNRFIAFAEPWPRLPDPPDPTLGWRERSEILRERVRAVLTLPGDGGPLVPITHRERRGEGYVVQSVTYASEPGSRITALLYLPDRPDPGPAVIVGLGHGGSKSALYGQYAGQLYAKMGFVCLVPDTIGEEERNARGEMGARAHDMPWLGQDYPEFVRERLQRMVMGKITWDLIRGVDYLSTRDEVDAERIGIAGFSLGGLSACCLTMLDSRVRASTVSGWVFQQRFTEKGRWCTRMSWTEMARFLSGAEATALAAQHAPTLYLLGDSEVMLDPTDGGRAIVRGLETNIESATRILTRAGIETAIEAEITLDGDHRPLFLTAPSVAWLQRYLMRPEERRPLPDRTISYGEWADSQGQRIERLYDTEARERGNRVVDIGVRYEDPSDLACFPERPAPAAEYTMRGWIEAQLRMHEKG